VLDEPESGAVRARVGGNPLFSSALAQVELKRAVARHDPRDLPRAEGVLAAARLVAVDQRVLSRAASIEPSAVRTLDAIHVASALALGDALDAFVTYDGRQAGAAKAAGLAVESPS
jgi:hypothetical protein